MKNTELKKLSKLYGESQRYREHLYADGDWRRFENYWKGIYPAAKDVLCVPILVSDAQRQKSAILGGNARVMVTSNDAELMPTARVLTSQLNYLMRVTNLYEELTRTVQDTLTLGTGFLIDGFGSQYGVSPRTSLEGFESSAVSKDNRRLEYNDNVNQDLPWSLRVHPSDIYFPPGTVDQASAYGFFHRYVRHIDEVRADEKYNKHRQKVEPNAAAFYDSSVSARNVEMEDMVLLIDWYDLRNSHRVTFSEDYAYPLGDDIDELLVRIDRLPIHAIVFNNNSRCVWGTSDFALQEPLAQEINDIRTMQMRLRRQQIVKGVYDIDKLAEDGEADRMEESVRNMSSDQVMSLIGIHGDPHSFLADFKPSQPWDLIPQVNLAKEEIQNFGGGIGPNQRGQLASGRHTKYEVQKADSHFDATMIPRRQTVGKRIIDIVTNWAAYIQDFWVDPRLIRTRDAVGRPVVVQFEGADLRGDFHYEVSIESMRTKGPEERMAEANMIFERAMVGVQMGQIDFKSLFGQFLSHIDTDWDIEALLGGGGPQPGAPQPFGQFQQQFQKQSQQMQQGPNPAQMAQMAQGQRQLPGSSSRPGGGAARPQNSPAAPMPQPAPQPPAGVR